MSVPVLILAALLSAATPADVENRNDCWKDSGKSGPREWGRYDYHLVNKCDREIHVWDAVVLWREDRSEAPWTCGQRTELGCRPLIVEPGGTRSYVTRSDERYWWFACFPDDAKCNELGKKWADRIDGLSRAFDPGEVARSVGYSIRGD